MKILLDESVPQKLRLLIEGGRRIVVTTWFQGWSGLKNGALLNAAEAAGFDLFNHRRPGTEVPAEPRQSENRHSGSQHE